MCMVHESGPHARERNQSQARGGKTHTGHREILNYSIALHTQLFLLHLSVPPLNVTDGTGSKNNWKMQP